MKIFKIQRTDDLLFSKGGTNVTWSKIGKNWNNPTAIANHLVQFTIIPDTWIVIEYDIEDDAVHVTKTSAAQMYAEIKERSRKRNAKRIERFAEWQLEVMKRRQVELEKELEIIRRKVV